MARCPFGILLATAFLLCLLSIGIALYAFTGTQSPRKWPSTCVGNGVSQPPVPVGIAAPLSAMAMTFALTPQYALSWIQGQMPVNPPDLSLPSQRPILVAHSNLRSAMVKDFGRPAFPDSDPRPGGALISWWKRQTSPARLSAPIADHVHRAQQALTWPRWQRQFWRVACMLRIAATDQTCTEYSESSTIHAPIWFLLNLTSITRDTCTAESGTWPHSARIPLSTTHTQTAAKALKELIIREIEDIVSHETSLLLTTNLTSTTPAYIPQPPILAPWSPARSVTNPHEPVGRRNRQYHLSSAPLINGRQIPSLPSQRQMHALSALYAQVLWAEFVTRVLFSYQTLVNTICDSALSAAHTYEDTAFEELKKTVLAGTLGRYGDDERLVGSVLDLCERLLGMGQGREEGEQGAEEGDDSRSFPLLKPFPSGVSANRFGRTRLTEDARRKTVMNEDRSRRPSAEQLLKGEVLKMLKEDMIRKDSRDDEEQNTRPECLWHRGGRKSGEVEAAAAAAVWEFWQSGASPMWITFGARKGQRSGNEGALYRENVRADVFDMVVDLDDART